MDCQQIPSDIYHNFQYQKGLDGADEIMEEEASHGVIGFNKYLNYTARMQHYF